MRCAITAIISIAFALHCCNIKEAGLSAIHLCNETEFSPQNCGSAEDFVN